MYTLLKDNIPEQVLGELERLNNRNRLINRFAVFGVSHYKTLANGEEAYQIGIFVEDRKIWGGFRSTIESQLVSAAVCSPDFTAQQELKWRELRQVLNQFFDKDHVKQALFQYCRNTYLRGLVDLLEEEGKLPLATYLRCKQIINDLGADYFEKDYVWYFGREKSLPNDYWRGLEESV